jgi:antitoxin MazE
MTPVFLDIKYWGNNLGVRLPAAIARAARLQANQRVSITVEEGRVVIAPVTNASLSLTERLERFDPERHGGEAMSPDATLGAEGW